MFPPTALISFVLFSLLVTAHNSGKGKWVRHDLIGQGPRQEHSVTSLNNESIWLVGGVEYTMTPTKPVTTANRVEYFRLRDQTWHVAAPIPLPLNHINLASVEDNIYLLGGLSGGIDWISQNANFVYHTKNDSWTPLAPQPNSTSITIRGSSAMGVYNSTIYLVGGMTYLQVTSPNGTQDAVSTVSSYNTLTDTWDLNYPPLPEPRQHVGSSVVGSKFYVLGGRENGVEKVRNTTYILDLAEPSSGWKVGAEMPTARGGLACAAIDTIIYCFGGEGNVESSEGVFDQVEAYDTIKDEWKVLDPMPVLRHGWGVAAANGRIYVPGGGLREGGWPTGWVDSFEP